MEIAANSDGTNDMPPSLPPPVKVKPDCSVISGFWARSLALFLDSLFLGLVGAGMGLFLFDALAGLAGWGRLLGFGVALVYFGVLNSSVGRGQTIGKRIMKIEVVDRAGHPISLGRSFLRYAVLGIPFFLNGLLLPPDVVMSPIGSIVSFILFGFGGVIIYLYIFNRRTRQSLHDMVVRTYVVKRKPEGSIDVPPLWKFHFIVVIIWLAAVVGLLGVVQVFSTKGMLSDLLRVQREIYSTGKVHTATLMQGTSSGKSWGKSGGKKWETTFLKSNAIWKTRPKDYQAAAAEIAIIILKEYAAVSSK